MRSFPLWLLVAVALVPTLVSAYQPNPPEFRRLDRPLAPVVASESCHLEKFDLCSGWYGAYNAPEGGIWGVIMDPRECGAEDCHVGGYVNQITLYINCFEPGGVINDVSLWSVDANNCRTGLLYSSGPVTVTG